MTRTMILLTTLLALAALAPGATHAQGMPLPEPGARVRFAAQGPGGRWENRVGTLVAAGGDSLVLRPGGGGAPVVLRAGQVGALQVSAGLEHRGRSALRSGAAAATIGIVVGVLVSAATADKGLELPGSATVGKSGSTFGWLAGIAGMLHGHSHPRERWGPLVVPAASAQAAPSADGGVALSMSVKL